MRWTKFSKLNSEKELKIQFGLISIDWNKYIKIIVINFSMYQIYIAVGYCYTNTLKRIVFQSMEYVAEKYLQADQAPMLPAPSLARIRHAK